MLDMNAWNPFKCPKIELLILHNDTWNHFTEDKQKQAHLKILTILLQIIYI